MADKKLRVVLELDDKAFVAGMKRVQELMNKMQSGFMSQQGKINQYMQSQGITGSTASNSREGEQAQRKMSQESDRIFQKTTTQLNIIKRIHADINKELASGLATEQRKAELLQRRSLLEKKEDKLAGIDSGGAQGGGSSLLTTGIKGLVTAAVYKTILNTAQQISNAPINIAAMQGSAVQGFLGKQLSEMQTGQFAYTGMFGSERQQAMKMGRGAAERQKYMDILNPLRWAGFFTGEEGARTSQLTTEGTNRAFEGLVGQQPYKKAAVDLLQQNSSGFLGTQRMLGMGDKGLFNFLSGVTGAGFMPEQGMQAAQSIIGAGGSSRMGTDAAMALKAQRGLDLTNAPELLGKLSGNLGGSGASKNALIEIFATGQQIGLDRSHFAEENRRFVQGVTEIAAKSGLTSTEAISNLSQLMGSFVTGTNTQRGIEASKTAFQAVSGIGASTSGYTGGQNISSLMGMQGIEKVKDPALFQGLASLELSEISPKNDKIISAASMMGISPDTLASNLKMQKLGVSKSSLQRKAAFDAGVGEISAAAKAAFAKSGKFDPSQFNFKSGGAAETGLGGLESMFGVLGVKGQPEQRQAVMGVETEMAMQQLQDQLSGSKKPEDIAMLKRIQAYRESTVDKANEGYNKGGEGTGRKLDEILGISASQASSAVKTLASSIDELTAAARRFEGKRGVNESLSKEATQTMQDISQQGGIMNWLRYGGDQGQGVRSLLDRAQRGEDLTPQEIERLHRISKNVSSHNQNQTTSPTSGGK